MDCRTFRRKHLSYLDDTLSGVETGFMREHLQRCDACSRHDAAVRRALLVVRNGIPVGMVTEEDILKAVAQGKDLAQTSVIDIIDQGLNTIPLTKSLPKNLETMNAMLAPIVAPIFT